MKKRAEEILKQQMIKFLFAGSKNEFNDSLSKIGKLADILDQSGDEVSANKLDELLKQAGFWTDLLSGIAGGGGVKLWEAIKAGKLKEGLGGIIKGSLEGAGAAVVANLIMKWLDEVPVIGPYLKELAGAEKLRSLLVGVFAGAVAESDFVDKLVDQTILAIEQVLGLGGAQKKEAPKPVQSPAKEEASDMKPFQMNVKAPGIN